MSPTNQSTHRNLIISAVVAVAHHGVIGAENALPWHLPDDLRFFKKVTLGKPIVMGRKTWESLGRPLPKRHNIVLTRQADYVAKGATVVSSAEEALRVAGDVPELMVIGGGEIFRLFWPLLTRVYLTKIDAEIAGDVFFPAIDSDQWRWFWISRHLADAHHRYAFTTQCFERKRDD